MGAAAQPGSKFLPRGIWRGPVPRDGSPTIIAVDRRKRCLGEIVLHPEVDPAWVRRVLTELLETVDPSPELSIAQSADMPLPAWPKREGTPIGLSAKATLLLFRKP